MEINVGSYKYRNNNIQYVKNLFKDYKKAKGTLIAISNGGYKILDGIDFGFRIYFDTKKGVYNCQVCSKARAFIKCVDNIFFEYSVVQEGNTTLDSVIASILYNEYTDRLVIAAKNKR